MLPCRYASTPEPLKNTSKKYTLMGSTHIRCGDSLKDKMDDFLEDTDRYDTQTDFVNTALRNQLERERLKDERMSAEDEENMRQIIREEIKALQDKP